MKRIITLITLIFFFQNLALAQAKISFPRDEGSHPYIPGIEWWYVVMHVQGEQTGHRYSVMVAHFNNLVRLFTITNVTQKRHQSGTSMGLIKSKMGELNLEHHTPDGVDFLRSKSNQAYTYELASFAKQMNIHANLKSQKMPLMVDGDGLTAVGSSGWSYYYSLTSLAVKGDIEFQGIKEPVSGIAWMDHQWGPFLVSPISFGKTFETYEWFALQLDNGYELMVKNIFDRKNRIPQTAAYTSVEIVNPLGGFSRTLNKRLVRTRFYKDPKSGHLMSMGWRLAIPELKMHLDITPDLVDQMVTFPFNGDFWEGSLAIKGVQAGIPVTGRGFGELIHRYEVPELKISLKESTILSDMQVKVNWIVQNPDEGNPLSFDLYLLVGEEEHLIAKAINNNQYAFFINDFIKDRKNQKIAFKVVANSSDKTISNFATIKANYLVRELKP